MTIETLLHSPQFKQALFDVQNEECERLEAELALEPVHVSPVFERRMQRLIRAERRPYYRFTNTNGKKAVLALAATLILLVTLVFSVSAIREPVVRFFIEVYEKFSQIFYHQQEEEQFPAMLETHYSPSWLPEGYQEDAAQTVDAITFCEWVYTSETREDILFRQYIITTSTLGIDTEGNETKPITVNGREGLFYTNKGVQHILWSDGKYGFLLFGSISEAGLFRMAKSIQTVEMKK